MPWYDAEGADLVRAQQTPPPTSSFPDFTGAGSPEGVITAAVGKSYVDTANGALYFKSSTFETGVADNIGWVLVGGSDATGYASVPGVLYRAGDVHLAAGTAQGLPGELTAGQVYIGDAWSSSMGNGNGIRWTQPGGDDSAQSASVQLGDSGQFNWLFKADGTTEFPGPITAAGQVRSIEAAFLGPAGQNITLADEGAYAGTGNSIQIRSTQTDGSQWVLIALGPNGEFATQFKADGTTEFPGPIKTDHLVASGNDSDQPGRLALIGQDLAGNGGVWITDQHAQAGSGNGIYWITEGTDGQQQVNFFLGANGAFQTAFNADGTTAFPGPVTVAGKPLVGIPEVFSFRVASAETAGGSHGRYLTGNWGLVTTQPAGAGDMAQNGDSNLACVTAGKYLTAMSVQSADTSAGVVNLAMAINDDSTSPAMQEPGFHCPPASTLSLTDVLVLAEGDLINPWIWFGTTGDYDVTLILSLTRIG